MYVNYFIIVLKFGIKFVCVCIIVDNGVLVDKYVIEENFLYSFLMGIIKIVSDFMLFFFINMYIYFNFVCIYYF